MRTRVNPQALANYERYFLRPILRPGAANPFAPTPDEVRLETGIGEAHARMGRLRRQRLDALRRIQDEVVPMQLGYSHAVDFAREALGISRRAAQKGARLARALANLPATREAFERNYISESQIAALLPVLQPDSECKWIRHATYETAGQLRARIAKSMGAQEDPAQDRSSANSRTIEDEAAPLPDFKVDLTANDRFPCLLDAFQEEVSRRIGLRASRAQTVETLLAEFGALRLPGEEAPDRRLRRRP